MAVLLNDPSSFASLTTCRKPQGRAIGIFHHSMRLTERMTAISTVIPIHIFSLPFYQRQFSKKMKGGCAE